MVKPPMLGTDAVVRSPMLCKKQDVYMSGAGMFEDI